MTSLKSSQQLLQLLSAHFKEIIREPGVIFWGIVFPILMALGLGVAFTKKGEQIKTLAVIAPSDQVEQRLMEIDRLFHQRGNIEPANEKSPAFYKFTLRSEKVGNLTYRLIPADWEQAMILLKRGNIDVIMDVKESKPIFHFDPGQPEAELLYFQLSKLLNSPLEAATLTAEDIEPLTLTGTRYIDFLIPGLIAMGIMMSSLWGISYGIIEK